jgi:hypothetical protein
MLCFRLLNEDEPAAPLAAAVKALRQGQPAGNVFDVDPVSFATIPGTRFAYWVGVPIRKIFSKLPKYAEGKRDARHGPATSDDFKLLRAWWEVVPSDISRNRIWVPYAKGGAAIRFYLDQPLIVNWDEERFTFRGFFGRPGRWQSRLESSDCFFKPGFTWPLRAASFTPQILPSGCVFSARGYAAFSDEEPIDSLMGLAASRCFDLFFKVLLGRFGFPEFVVGALQELPVPNLNNESGVQLGKLAVAGWSCLRRLDSGNISSHVFLKPGLLCVQRESLDDLSKEWAARIESAKNTISLIQEEIDALALRLYELQESDLNGLVTTLIDDPDLNTESDPEVSDEEASLVPSDSVALISELLDYAVGIAFGRWDARYATGATSTPAEPDPFAALPVCAPGMLQNAAGLPATPSDVPADYPLAITWSGIMVDDERNPDDLARRVHEVLEVIFPGRSDAIADEAYNILGAKSLRDWFRSPSGFFAGHLKRHSKSRRQAPIFWPLSSPKGLYTVWLYLHRLTTDTFFTVLRDHVKPRLEDEERHVFNLMQQAGPSATPSQARDIAASEEQVEDLRALRDELQCIAPLWRPDLNDGVVINHAPLWRMANHASWRKALKETWDSLVAGKYDWAHLALHLWPERVIPKCAKDRSLAIAHDLESFFWGTDPKTGEVVAVKRTGTEVAALVAERTSSAVKAALDSLLTAPATVGGTTKRGRKTKTA